MLKCQTWGAVTTVGAPLTVRREQLKWFCWHEHVSCRIASPSKVTIPLFFQLGCWWSKWGNWFYHRPSIPWTCSVDSHPDATSWRPGHGGQTGDQKMLFHRPGIRSTTKVLPLPRDVTHRLLLGSRRRSGCCCCGGRSRQSVHTEEVVAESDPEPPLSALPSAPTRPWAPASGSWWHHHMTTGVTGVDLHVKSCSCVVVLCRSISTSLSQQERLDQLIEAAMKVRLYNLCHYLSDTRV